MKATLEFRLPEEQQDLDDAQNGVYYRAGIEMLDQELKRMIKYEDKTMISIQEIKERLNRILQVR